MAALVAVSAYLGVRGGEGDGGGGGEATGTPVRFGEVQAVFEKYACTSCHPGVNSSLDLTERNSYDQLVGIPALEDPSLVRVVAGDPGRSFLYLKVGGDPPLADIPAIGTRMPPRAPPIDGADLELIEDWILQGAKGSDGKTGGPRVPTPGSPPTELGAEPATETEGSATITGSVVDERRRPIEGALVTLLLQGDDEEGGEEHYRVAVTDATGGFTLERAPAGRFLLKAYGPNTIYVSRIVALAENETQEIRFGLPDRVVENPSISNPAVEQNRLTLTVEGSDLDGNYTLAVNPRAGRVFELHSPENAPGTWSASIEQPLEGPWIFLAVDETCNVSEFLTASG